MAPSTKSNPGNFFEDFKPGETLIHATPQTVTEGDIALYRALTGNRYAQYSSAEFAKAAGLPGLCADPLHAFHIVFGNLLDHILEPHGEPFFFLKKKKPEYNNKIMLNTMNNPPAPAPFFFFSYSMKRRRSKKKKSE